MATKINSFKEAKEFMANRRNAYYKKLHSSLQCEKLANSHPLQERYGMRYYATIIVKYYEGYDEGITTGFVTLNSGGYRSNFTNKLLNKYGPENVRVYQRQHQLYITFPQMCQNKRYFFFDGITFTDKGEPANFKPEDIEVK